MVNTIKKHTLYLGLNDKDSKQQKISTVEAYKTVENLLKNNNFDGATIFEAVGLYKHDNGVYVTESTLRIEILFSTDEKIKTLANTLKQVFNQESIALQVESINSQLV